jgi:phospholipid/cholesterol/gamma-HCH transport system substrate-binding protein
MRSRTSREGTVGLLILAGIGIFAGLIAWVQGFSYGKQRYQVTIEFSDAQGVEIGSILRYRGVEIGKVVAIRPTSHRVNVDVDITAVDLRIPYDAVVAPYSATLLGEVVMDVQLQTELPEDETLPGPLDPACNPDVILCEGSLLQGRTTPDFADLIEASYRLSETFSDPLLLAGLEEMARTAGEATSGISGLTEDFSSLASTLNDGVGNLDTDNLNTAVSSLGSAADQMGVTAVQVGGAVGSAANQMEATVVEARNILNANRAAIDVTLLNFSQASEDLIYLFNHLNPTVQQVAEGDLISNLETLSKNLRIASSQLRVATAALNDPSNVQVLQETLDSARAAFQNVQKITTDLDELTGDPFLRNDVRNILDGFGNLFSAAEHLEQQMQLAQDTNLALGGTTLYQEAELGTTDWSTWDQANALLEGWEGEAEVGAEFGPKSLTEGPKAEIFGPPEPAAWEEQEQGEEEDGEFANWDD